jgi:aromatic-L-amino-acid/L-tryptophan decarboxylase
MSTTNDPARTRMAPIDMSPAVFRRLGHRAVDAMADLMASLPERPVTTGETAPQIRERLGQRPLPARGEDAERTLDEALELMSEHSLFIGHPRFMGYITSSSAPIGALADLIAACVNPNLGGWPLSPMASEIEAQTINWIAELLGFPVPAGGILVSGGNMANFIAFWTARRHKLEWNVRKEGFFTSGPRRPRVYTSEETHTWIQKAADLSGLGTDCIRWIPTDNDLRMDVALLRRQVESDRAAGDLPFLVIGNAGTVSTGAIDPLPEIADLAKELGLWFHVDGAYGAPAAALPEAPADLKGLCRADSVVVDPHKWLYAPLEAGCVLVKNSKQLRDTFSYHPPYYPDADPAPDAPPMYHELGPQNSRGFRALKVWMGFRQVGRDGYTQMMGEDMSLARALYHRVSTKEELEPGTQNLSITTFRFVPTDLRESTQAGAYLNDLNREIVAKLQSGGKVYITHAVVKGTYLLRACVVNFRTSLADIEAVPALVIEAGREIDRTLRPAALRSTMSATP